MSEWKVGDSVIVQLKSCVIAGKLAKSDNKKYDWAVISDTGARWGFNTEELGKKT